MRSTVLLLLLLVGCHASTAALPPNEIRAVLQAQQQAWNRGDIDGYMNGYGRATSTTFVSGDTVTRGWEVVRDRYKKRYPTPEKMGKLTFSDIDVKLLTADAALATGRWQLHMSGENPRGRFTLILRYFPEGWRIVHDHTSAAN